MGDAGTGSRDLLLKAPLCGRSEPLGKRNWKNFLSSLALHYVSPQGKHMGSGV